jgi:tetratricopeptide (TPR) repeat protein
VKPELEEQFAEAIKFQDAGQLESAKKILLALTETDPQSIRILAALGLVCWELGYLEEAVRVFTRAIELAPTSEGMSKGLFHCLWNLERKVEALEEIKRFQTISDSEDYRAIVNEINEKW